MVSSVLNYLLCVLCLSLGIQQNGEEERAQAIARSPVAWREGVFAHVWPQGSTRPTPSHTHCQYLAPGSQLTSAIVSDLYI